jgi:hypothetical protein
MCLSIRWFVPQLAPVYSLLALRLRHGRPFRVDFLLLSAWGGVLAVRMREGAWTEHMVPGFWPTQAAALLTWLWLARSRATPWPRFPTLLSAPFPGPDVSPTPAPVEAKVIRRLARPARKNSLEKENLEKTP